MQPVYPEDEIIDPRQLPGAYDTSGVPVNPPAEGFQMLGEVQGTSTNNAYIAEQEAERIRRMSAKERAEAEQAAIRFAGQQKYRQLIQGGAKPEEAMKLAAPEMFWNNPNALVASLRATRQVTPFEPSVIERNGVKFAVTGPNRASVIPPPKPVVEKQPPDSVINQKLLMERLKALRSGPLAIAADPNEIASLEKQLLEGSTNWMGHASAPVAPTPTATPLPKSESELKKGITYQTRRGPATWNGTKFVQ